MRGYEVILKFLMISCQSILKSQFSWGPLQYFSYFSSPPYYGYPTCLVPLDRYFQDISQHGYFKVHGPFSIKNISIYQNTIIIQYPCPLSETFLFWTIPLLRFKSYS